MKSKSTYQQKESSLAKKNNFFVGKHLPVNNFFIQPRFALSQPNDIYEQEADAVADKVMRMPADKNENLFFKPVNILSVQRKCEGCEEEEKLQRKEDNSGEIKASDELQTYIGSRNTGGSFLSNETRSFFEPRFGYDFSNVRVHNDSVAAKSAQSINALAYTSGNNIVFNENQYLPDTESGKKLLGHELTHVVQQNIPSKNKNTIKRNGDTSLVQRKEENIGLTETEIEIKWTSDFTDFYHQIIETTILSSEFRTINQACFWQPFHIPSFRFKNRHEARHLAELKEGDVVRVHVSAFYDETKNLCLDGVNIWHDEDIPVPVPVPELEPVSGPVPTSPSPNLLTKGLIALDINTPGRVYIKANGITPKLIALEMYEDESKSNYVWAYWSEKKKDQPFTADSELEPDSSVMIEYMHLSPLYKENFDISVTIIGRDFWGARPPITGDPKRDYTAYDKPLEDVYDTIVVHHSGNKGYKTMKEVQDYHMDKKEAADINYHIGINLYGGIYEGRPLEIKGAHVPKANTGKLGIVLLADLDENWYEPNDEITPEMETSLLRMIHYLKAKFPGIKFLGGHKEITPDRSCPGNLTMKKMSTWRTSTGLTQPAMTK